MKSKRQQACARLAAATARVGALERVVVILRDALLRADRNCDHLHHASGQYHKAEEPCPVEAIIKAALAIAVKEKP